MTQLELFTQSETDDQSYHVVIPANPLVKPGSAEAVKMTDTSGQKYFPLFSKSDQIGSFVKTFLGTSLWVSTRCFLTWQTKPITQSKHFILELWPSMPHTEECDSGSSQEIWATPNTMDSLPSRSYEAMMRQATTGGRKNRRRPGNLREQIDPLMQQAYDEARAKANNQDFKRKIEPEMWPTPIASTGGPYKNHKGDEKKIPSSGNPLATAVAMWPTPQARDYKGPSGRSMKGTETDLPQAVKMWPTPRARDWKMTGDVANWAESAIGDECLRRAVGRKEATPGSLNPQWVEWLMGYPEGWTDLKD